MAISNAWKDKENEAGVAESTVIANLYNKINKLEELLLKMRITFADADVVYNRIMDANGNNDREHYAKTMMFYGRKFCGKDALLGVHDGANQDKYKYDFTPGTPNASTTPPGKPFDDAEVYIKDFYGIDYMISDVDKITSHSEGTLWSGYYQFTLFWDITNAVTAGLFQTTPAKHTCRQDGHAVGTEVIMPTILNLDTEGVGTGTNTYVVQPGCKILGWRIDQTKTGTGKGPVYEIDDSLNAYHKEKDRVTGVAQPILDTRIFAFPPKTNPNKASGFRLPFRKAGSDAACGLNPVFPKEIYFVLEWVSVWFDITFFVPHSKYKDSPDGIVPSAPAKTPIRTKLGQTITLPLASMIEVDDGWKIDTSVDSRGQWTTITGSGTQQVFIDDDGNSILVPEYYYIPGNSYLVNGDGTGNNIPASCRTLYLKVVPV